MKKLFDISNKKIYILFAVFLILSGVLGVVGFHGTTRVVFCLVVLIGIFSLFPFDKIIYVICLVISGIIIFILVRFLVFSGDSPFVFMIYVSGILESLLLGIFGIRKTFLEKENNKKLFIFLNIIAICYFLVSVIYYFSLVYIGSWYGGRWLLLRGAYVFFTFISMLFINKKIFFEGALND